MTHTNPSTRAPRLALVLALGLATALTACGETTYVFDDTELGEDDSARTPRERSNSQYIRSMYTDVLGRAPTSYDINVSFNGQPAGTFPVDEQDQLMAVLDSIGDPTPMRALFAVAIVEHAESTIPDKSDVTDPTEFIAEQFRLYLGREAGAYELSAFVDEWNASDAVNPKTIIRALIASREYQSF